MDEIFDTFVTPATILVCLAAYLMTYVIRTVVQGLWRGAKLNHYWNELWLPLGPIVNGAMLGLAAKTFMWPDMANKTVLARMIYGAICGLFSAFVYSRIRSWLSSKAAAAGAAKAAKALPPEAPASDLEEGDSVEAVDAPLGGKGDDLP